MRRLQRTLAAHAFLALALAAPAAAGTVELSVVGLRPEQGGVVLVGLYRGEEGWLDWERAAAVRILPASADSLAVRFENVPPDSSYAVQVIHDKNRNGKFDMRWLPWPKPKEGGGVSHNHARRGPPEYGKAAFAVGEEPVALRIEMRY
jgi:uncharacterized protein (DUF2141 family)